MALACVHVCVNHPELRSHVKSSLVDRTCDKGMVVDHKKVLVCNSDKS